MLYFGLERENPLWMEIDVWHGSRICLLLFIIKGRQRWSVHAAVYSTWKTLRQGKGWHLCLLFDVFIVIPTDDPASSFWWRVMALILLILSLGMVIGLVALGIMCKYWLFAKDLIWGRQYLRVLVCPTNLPNCHYLSRYNYSNCPTHSCQYVYSQ
jgi:hypothetical protein